jgi:membrane protein DedA with SNARE-associated domain
MRTVAPIAISASHIRSRTFVLLNASSAAVWGVTMVWLGFWFGKAIDPWLSKIKSVTLVIAAVAVVLVIVVLAPRVLRRWRSRAVDQ